MDKRTRELDKLCEKYGASWEIAKRGGHYKIRLNGHLLSASGTPSNRDTFLKCLERDLRKAAATPYVSQTSLIGEAFGHGIPSQSRRNVRVPHDGGCTAGCR